jgi:HK97 family phage major capsid protein
MTTFEDRDQGLTLHSLDDLAGKTPEELRQIMDKIDAAVQERIQTPNGELRELTEDQDAAITLMLEVRNAAKTRIEKHNRIMGEIRDKPANVVSGFNMALGGSSDDPYASVRAMPVAEAQDRALRVLDNRRIAGHLRPDQKDQVERNLRRDTDLARRILVTENPAYRTAWMKMVTQPNPWLDDEEQRAMRAWEEYRAMSENTTTAGGFGIPVFIDPSIIMTAQGSGNPFLQLAKQVTINTNIWKGVSSAGVSWSFDTESSAVSDDSPTLAQPSVTVHMARGFIPYSIELGQDYPAFADEMGTLLATGYDELLIQKFSVGSGSGEPDGIITKLDATAGSEVLITTAGTIGAVDVFAAWNALPLRFQNNASWMMNVGVNSTIRQLGTTNFYAQTVNLTERMAETIMGAQVYKSAYFVNFTNTTGHQNALVVGDFSNYVIARRGGMSVELIPHLFDVTNNRPTGQRGWFAYARIGGDVAATEAFRLLNQT